MSLTDSHWLWVLVALPVLLLVGWRAMRRSERGLEALVGTRAGAGLLEQRRPGDRRLGTLLCLGAFTCLAIGAAGPEWGREVVRRAATGSDVVLLVDVSASMDSRDVAPSRLAEAQREALALVDQLDGSRIGVTAFAGDAVRLCPLTLDRDAVRLTLQSLSSATLSEPGTDLGRGLRAAARLVPQGRREEQALVVWTDGEDLEQGAGGAISELAHTGIRVFAVGVGTPGGDVIPLLDASGLASDVKRDENGVVVRSRLDERLLRDLARRTRGAYFAASRPGGELPRLLSALGSLARAGRGQRLVERAMARFPWFAGAAVVLIVVDLGRRRRRTRTDRAPGRRGRRAEARAAVALTAIVLAMPARGAWAQTDWARADGAFHGGRFAVAESLYARRLARGGSEALRFDLATARARNGKPRDAERAWSALAAGAGRPARESRYNRGTLLAQDRKVDDALAQLRSALERDPSDEDARWNYEVLQRRREQERSRQKPDGAQPPPEPSPAPSPSTPKPSPSSPRLQPPSPPPQPQPQQQRPGSQPLRMDRLQADRLLDALQDLERFEKQRQRRVRVLRDRKGRDW